MELRQQGSTVHVDLEDHRNEDYKQVKKIKPFAGKGHTLGSPAPTVVSSPVSTPTQAPAVMAAAEQRFVLIMQIVKCHLIVKNKFHTVPMIS